MGLRADNPHRVLWVLEVCADLHVLVPLKQRQQTHRGPPLDALEARSTLEPLLPVEDVRDRTPSDEQIDELLRAVAVRRDQEAPRLIHLVLYPDHALRLHHGEHEQNKAEAAGLHQLGQVCLKRLFQFAP